MDILVLYYSRHGSTAKLAQQVTRGVNAVENCTARLRTVPPVSPDTQASEPTVPVEGAPFVQMSDLLECGGVLMGSPTRFGNMAAALKYFLDGTSGAWMNGALRNKPAGLFTSTSSLHGGQETTLLSMALPLIHHGMLLVGLPYSLAELNNTRTGGTPYGASHVSFGDNEAPLSNDEAALARALGRRVAEAALRLEAWDRP